MSLLTTLFPSKTVTIFNYSDFWNWFLSHEKDFFKAVQENDSIEKNFFSQLGPALTQLHEGICYLAGMLDPHTAELILTADGVIENIVFVEELVQAAPSLSHWKFTALKPETENAYTICIQDYTFGKEQIAFYPIEHQLYPDEIDLVITYTPYFETDQTIIHAGVHLFLDNYLGELTIATSIDQLQICIQPQATQALIPITKLKSYLQWREKEFVEKYQFLAYDTSDDVWNNLSATLPNGQPLIAMANYTLLQWPYKASHPWIVNVCIDYGKEYSFENGLPSEEIFELIEELESSLASLLPVSEGYLKVASQTADNEHSIYLACRNFRAPSKILSQLLKEFEHLLTISYTIYKDKYWQSLQTFNVS